MVVAVPVPAERAEPLWERWSAIFVCALVAIFVLAALRPLDGLLHGMHGSGQGAYGIGDVAHVLKGPRADATNDVLVTWRSYTDERLAPGTATPLEVSRWWAIVDSLVFVPAYLAGLLLLLRRIRDRLTAEDARSERIERWLADRFQRGGARAGRLAYLRAIRVAAVATVVAAVADLVENGVTSWLVEDALDPPPIIRSPGDLVWTLWIASLVKWVALGLALLTTLVVAVVLWVAYGDLVPQVRRVLHRLRVHLVVVALLAGALLVPEQVQDLIRRWDAGQLLAATVLALALSVSTCVLGRRLALLPDPDGTGGGIVPQIILAGIVLLGLVLTLIHVFTDYDVGWGLAIPAAFVVGLSVPWLYQQATGGGGAGAVAAAVPPPPPPPPPPPFGSTALPWVVAAAVPIFLGAGVLNACFGLAVYEQRWTWDALWVLLAAALPLVPALAVRWGGLSTWWNEPLLVALPGPAAALLVLERTGELEPWVLVVVGILIGFYGGRLYFVFGSPSFPGLAWVWPVLGGVAVLAVALLVAVIVDVWWTGDTLGGPAILIGFFCAAAALGGLALWANDTISPPTIFLLGPLKRIPVFALIFLWFVIAGCADTRGYHDVRIEGKRAGGLAEGVSVGEAFRCWLFKNGLEISREPFCPARADTRSASKSTTPLILIATTGGGIRSAYWTDLVLDCLFEGTVGACPGSLPAQGFDRSNSVFAASGISGGSLGLATYAGYLTDKAREGPGRDLPDWVDGRLSRDPLSPSLAWGLFVEVPQAFLRFGHDTDRAEVLERGWGRRTDDPALAQGLFATWRSHQEVPLLLLNGTSVEDGCRFNTSVLNGNVETGLDVRNLHDCRSTDAFAPNQLPLTPGSALSATRDLADFLCRDQDITLATAALLSARFPFVNPSGRLERQCTGPATGRPGTTFIVDGGYLDTSGASTVVELFEALQPLIARHNRSDPAHCVVPYLIQIDNGFEAGAARVQRRPPELVVPGKAVLSARLGRAADARELAALLFSDRPDVSDVRDPWLRGDRYAHFVNVAHAGPKAPLGWAQSQVSEQELREQLRQSANREEFETVRSWFQPGRETPGCG